MNLYIDVDGVILGKADPNSPHITLARHAREFLEFAVANFHCYWLTSRCDGTSASVLKCLRPYCDAGFLALASQIKPTLFKVLKTEVVAGEFFWLDDSPMAAELAWLDKRGLRERWIAVNTRKQPDDLRRAMQRLAAAVQTGQV